MNNETKKKHEAIVAYYRTHETDTWDDLAAHFGTAPTVVRRIVTDAERARDPSWKKPRRRTLHDCQEPGCGAKFVGVRGYNGKRDARYCPEHRKVKG